MLKERTMRYVFGISKQHDAFAVTDTGNPVWALTELDGILYREMLPHEEAAAWDSTDADRLHDLADRLDALRVVWPA
jgi:hypothetical protein